MSDVKPRRAARPSARSEISPGEQAPIETAPTIVPPDPSAAEVASVAPESPAEPLPEIVPAATEPAADPVAARRGLERRGRGRLTIAQCRSSRSPETREPGDR